MRIMKRDYLSKFLYLGIFAITFFACNSGSNNNEENNEGDTPSAFVGATSGGLSIQPTLPAGPAAGSDQKTLAVAGAKGVQLIDLPDVFK